jgi:DNA ligase-associated metallophosphoesterase
MHYKDVFFANQNFSIFPNGELYWQNKKTLIISDLHFEKGSFFSETRQFIPPFDTIETLRQLSKFIDDHPVEMIIFLGDLVHDKFAFQRMALEAKELFFEILKNINCTLTVGNHDDTSFLKDIGLNLTENIIIDDICFSHHPTIDKKFSVFGHYHPKVRLKINSRGIWTSCFIANKEKLLMPSYGYFTGGLSIKSIAIQKLFEPEYEIYPLTKEKVYKLAYK